MNGAEYLLFILMLSVFLGFELINKVPATLHTPLMSGANAISGITVVGAVALAGNGQGDLAQWLGAGAVALATVNVIGGYLVTDRMLGFFKKREDNHGYKRYYRSGLRRCLWLIYFRLENVGLSGDCSPGQHGLRGGYVGRYCRCIDGPGNR